MATFTLGGNALAGRMMQASTSRPARRAQVSTFTPYKYCLRHSRATGKHVRLGKLPAEGAPDHINRGAPGFTAPRARCSTRSRPDSESELCQSAACGAAGPEV